MLSETIEQLSRDITAMKNAAAAETTDVNAVTNAVNNTKTVANKTDPNTAENITTVTHQADTKNADKT